MKAKVLIEFNDKHTKKACKKGEIINVTAKRATEILSKGKYIQLVEDENPATTAKKENK